MFLTQREFLNLQRKKIKKNMKNQTINDKCISTIRTLAMDAIQKANSGHPGTPMAMAPLAFTLYDKHLRHSPINPNWPNRDKFILSAGHASMLLYGTLHVMGYDIPLDDIINFRQLGSKCPGHPEFGHTPGVETTTGPLGQGLATSVGFAIAQKWLATHFNRPGYNLIDYNIFSLAGDGCMMEGISCEAASIAGHLGLNNLIWIYDSNQITIEGRTSLAFSENVAERFKSYNWNVISVKDANDTEKIDSALQEATLEKDKPTLIIVESIIAYGAPTKQNTSGAHGSPLGEDEIKATKAFYGCDPDQKFFVSDEVKTYSKQIIKNGASAEEDWNAMFLKYSKEYPELASEFLQIQKGALPTGWENSLPNFDASEKGISTRKAGGIVLNAVASQIPWLVGGSADLAPSTLTNINTSGSIKIGDFSGRNIHYGIREHAMGAIANGIALSGLKTFASTFMVFSDYLRPSIRMSAMMNLPVHYIFTHDSIGVGEDGPTHQPIEQIAALRAMPNIDVIRPADANEVSVLWNHILNLKDRPAITLLSRQDLPVFDRPKYASADNALKGAYILADCDGQPEVILMATGSEVHLCIDAYEILMKEGIKTRVVSMPCWGLFERQSSDYIESVIPLSVKARVAVEAGSVFGWERYVGLDGKIIGMETFGASAPINILMEKFGFTSQNIILTARKLIGR
jgi:transketolase